MSAAATCRRCGSRLSFADEMPDRVCYRHWSVPPGYVAVPSDIDGDDAKYETGNREGKWVVWDDYAYGSPIQDEQ